jgi:hypothetical protein
MLGVPTNKVKLKIKYRIKGFFRNRFLWACRKFIVFVSELLHFTRLHCCDRKKLTIYSFNESEEVKRSASKIALGISEEDKPDLLHDLPPVTSDNISVNIHDGYTIVTLQ